MKHYFYSVTFTIDGDSKFAWGVAEFDIRGDLFVQMQNVIEYENAVNIHVVAFNEVTA